MATQLRLVLSPHPTAVTIFFDGKQPHYLGLVSSMGKTWLGGSPAPECERGCLSKGGCGANGPCKFLKVESGFATVNEAIAFVAKCRGYEPPFTFTVPSGLCEWKPKPKPVDRNLEEEADTVKPPEPRAIAPKKSAPAKPRRKKEKEAPATIESMVKRAKEIVKEELNAD